MMEVSDQVNTSNNESGADSPSGDAATQTAQDILDLDGVSSFKFQGQTYTPNQWAEIFQNSQKYGEASKYVDEDRTFWSNVHHDIERVLKNPARASEFKQVYPERFHAMLDRALKGTQRTENTSQENTNQIPKEFLEKFQAVEEKLKLFEDRAYNADVAAAAAKIDAILPKLMDKYELADQDKVLLEAEKALTKGMKLTDAVWERLVREDHEKNSQRADKYYQAKLKSQLQKGKTGADMGAGGSTPGQAPVKPKTFGEAAEAMEKHYRSQGLS